MMKMQCKLKKKLKISVEDFNSYATVRQNIKACNRAGCN